MTVGFEQEMYSVGEEDEFVMVCARLTGQIERNVVVNFFADPDFRGWSPTVFFCLSVYMHYNIILSIYRIPRLYHIRRRDSIYTWNRRPTTV